MVRVVKVYYEFSGLFSGNVNADVDFEYGEGTVVDGGCGATLFGEFWYFGGFGSYKRQVWQCQIGTIYLSQIN